jgi:hypothetical protein
MDDNHPKPNALTPSHFEQCAKRLIAECDTLTNQTEQHLADLRRLRELLDEVFAEVDEEGDKGLENP